MSAAPSLSVKHVEQLNLDNMRNTIHTIQGIDGSGEGSSVPNKLSSLGSESGGEEEEEGNGDRDSYSYNYSPSPSTSSDKNSPPPSTTSSKSLNVQRKSISHAHSQTTVKTPPSTWFKPRMKRIKMSGSGGGNSGDKTEEKQKSDSQIVQFVKQAFMAFDNTDKEEYAAFFSPDLKCTINALPYTVDGLKDVYNYITSSWVTTVQVDFKHVVEHPRLMGKPGEGEVGAVAELSGRDIFGNTHTVSCLFTMIIVVDGDNKQQIKEYTEVMSYSS